MEGSGKINYKDGTRFEGHFRHSKKDGHGRVYKNYKLLYKGKWKNDVLIEKEENIGSSL